MLKGLYVVVKTVHDNFEDFLILALHKWCLEDFLTMNDLNCTYWKCQFQRQNHTERKCTTITETQYNKFMCLNSQSWTMEQPFTLPWKKAIILTSWTSVKIFFLLKKSRINKKQNTLTHKELALHTHSFKFLLFNFHRPQFLTTIQIRNFLKIMQSTEYFQHKDAS